MQRRQRQQPSYRQRKGYDQAIVTLTDCVTRYHKDYWLGPYESPQSRELYHRVLAQWESGWPAPGTCDFDGGGVGINDFLGLLAN